MRKRKLESKVSSVSWMRSSLGDLAYAAMMATAKTVVSNLQALVFLVLSGEGIFAPLHERAPPRVRTAIATKQPTNAKSSRRARKAKKVRPPRKQVKMTAKAV